MSPKIFRQEAIEHHAGRGLEGDILRFDERWLRWTYRIVLAGLVAAVLYVVLFDVNEYASGIAFVRVEGRRTVATPFAGTIESVFVQPGQHVQKGQLLATMVPNVIPTPERLADFVRATRRNLESCDRDPDDFDFVPWLPVLIHDDPAVIDRALDNALVRWLAAIMGRLNMNDWAAYGIEAPFPLDWHYSTKLLPNTTTDRAFVDYILSRTTRKIAEMTYFVGNAEQVAAQIQPYIDAGATHVDILDMLPLVLEPADAQAALGRQIDVCARIKNRNPPTK